MKTYKITIQFTPTDKWVWQIMGYNIFNALSRRDLNGHITKYIQSHPNKCKVEVLR